jgi:hypothetical protein
MCQQASSSLQLMHFNRNVSHTVYRIAAVDLHSGRLALHDLHELFSAFFRASCLRDMVVDVRRSGLLIGQVAEDLF